MTTKSPSPHLTVTTSVTSAAAVSPHGIIPATGGGSTLAASPTTATRSPVSPPRGASLQECDYDVNPTFLYQAIEAKQWDHVATVFSTETAHTQAATWVIRKEKNGKLRWRLLPLHAAVIFGCPLEVLELLLSEYPAAAQCKDDQGMLPLHLAFRNDADWDVLEELLTAHPQAIHVKDRKGRTPLQCASSHFRKPASVLELITQIAVSTERQRAVQESRTMLEARIGALQDTHVQTLSKLKHDWQRQQEILALELDSTKEALVSSQRQLHDAQQEIIQNRQVEMELTTKLTQVTQALERVTQARAAEAALEVQQSMDRERLLTQANEELLLLVQSLLDQQTSMKVRLDQQAWQHKESMEQREQALLKWQTLTKTQEDSWMEDRNKWRKLLEESNQEAADQLTLVLERTKMQNAAGVGGGGSGSIGIPSVVKASPVRSESDMTPPVMLTTTTAPAFSKKVPVGKRPTTKTTATK